MQDQRSQALANMSRQVLARNRKLDRRPDATYLYTCPASGWYDHQWLWDSCFHAIALCTFDPAAAQAELTSLLAAQREDGFLPNVIMRDRRRWLRNRLFSLFLFKHGISNITQPPVVALALERIYLTTRDEEYVRSLLPRVTRVYTSLRSQRDPEHSGLLSIIHPWESGIDSTPAFDALLGIRSATPSSLSVYAGFYRLLMRYALDGWDTDKILQRRQFAVKNVLFNCIYAQGLRSLGRLYTFLGDEPNARLYDRYAEDTERAIVARMWHAEDELFYDLSGDEQLRIPTISSLFPLVLERVPRHMRDALVYRHLHNPEEFWTPYPLATVPRNHRTFNPADSKTVLWRGPVWINANWFLIRALEQHGYASIAAELAEKTKQLLLRNDTLYECYHPLTGAGEGQKYFSWSALVLDLLPAAGGSQAAAGAPRPIRSLQPEPAE